MLTRRWAPCKRCAKKYGTDVHRVDLKNLPPIHSHECACPIGTTTSTTYTGGMAPTTMLGTMPNVGSTSQATTMLGTMPSTNPAMVGSSTTYVSSSAPMATSNLLPAGFQTLPANPECKKCRGTGYKMSRKEKKNWKGCKVCAAQYGTNLATVQIP